MDAPYPLRHAPTPPSTTDAWDAPSRSSAEILNIGHFRPESTDHRPRTSLKLQWDDTSLHGIFRVEDRYVRAVQTQFNGPVCTDSCVELFIEPAGGTGYCNFEFNCCGVGLASHIADPTRTPKGFRAWRAWTPQEAALLQIQPSLSGPITEEIVDDCVWTLAFRIPFAPLLASTGAPAPHCGTVWRANAYKCGDRTSHPHWGSWRPVDVLNFHLPQCFGEMRFE